MYRRLFRLTGRLIGFSAVLSLSHGCGGGNPAAPTTVVTPVGSTFTVAGVVRENLPTGPGGTLVGVRVELVVKPGVLTTTRTDADGRFSFTGVAGRFDLRASKPGYHDQVVTVGPLVADGTANLALTPIPKTLSGRVFETAPTESTAVAGARVEVITGPNAGAAATADPTGAYSLPGLWGDFQVRVTRDGYEPDVETVSIGDTAPTTDAHLAPLATLVTVVVPSGVHEEPSYPIDVHHDGEIVVVDVHFESFEEGDSADLEVREGPELIARATVERYFPRQTIALRVPVVKGHRYTLSIAGAFYSSYTLTFTHPN